MRFDGSATARFRAIRGALNLAIWTAPTKSPSTLNQSLLALHKPTSTVNSQCRQNQCVCSRIANWLSSLEFAEKTKNPRSYLTHQFHKLKIEKHPCLSRLPCFLHKLSGKRQIGSCLSFGSGVGLAYFTAPLGAPSRRLTSSPTENVMQEIYPLWSSHCECFRRRTCAEKPLLSVEMF